MVNHKVRLVRSCELLLAGKIYHMGDELVVDDTQMEQLGDMVQRIDEPAPSEPVVAPQAEPAPTKTRAKK